MSYTLHCTKKLLDRISSTVGGGGDPSTRLGNWYATALFWKPQVALFVNERTLFPVLMPLAPAATVAARFPEQMETVFRAAGMAESLIAHELPRMQEVTYAKTANRSVVGIMNEFTFLAETYRGSDQAWTDALVALSLKLSDTPCSPLYKTWITPLRALQALNEESPQP